MAVSGSVVATCYPVPPADSLDTFRPEPYQPAVRVLLGCPTAGQVVWKCCPYRAGVVVTLPLV